MPIISQDSYRQTITTRYISPTNFRGTRIKASCAAGSLTVGYNYALSGEENHRAAADALISKLDWTGRHYGDFAGGVLKGGDYAWVHVAKDETTEPVRAKLQEIIDAVAWPANSEPDELVAHCESMQSIAREALEMFGGSPVAATDAAEPGSEEAKAIARTLLTRCAAAQTHLWNLSNRIEKLLGIEFTVTADLEGITVEDLMDGYADDSGE